MSCCLIRFHSIVIKVLPSCPPPFVMTVRHNQGACSMYYKPALLSRISNLSSRHRKPCLNTKGYPRSNLRYAFLTMSSLSLCTHGDCLNKGFTATMQRYVSHWYSTSLKIKPSWIIRVGIRKNTISAVHLLI